MTYLGKNLRKSGYVYVYGWFTLMCIRNWSIVNNCTPVKIKRKQQQKKEFMFGIGHSDSATISFPAVYDKVFLSYHLIWV